MLLLTLACSLGGARAARAEYSLAEAWAAAEAGNVELQQAAVQTEAAAAHRLEALSMQLTRVSTQWTAAFNQHEIQVPEELLVGVDAGSLGVLPLQTREAYGGSITVTQPLLRAAVVPAVQAATGAWRAAQAEERRARQQARAAAAQAYLGLLAAQAGQDVAERNVELAEAQRVLAQRRTDAGLEGRRAILQGELGVSRASRELLAASATLVDAEAAWRTVLGVPPRDDLVPPRVPTVPTTLEEAMAAAEAGRPDLEAADRRWRAARQQRSAGDMGWVPTIDLALRARFNFSPTLLDPLPAQAGVGFQLNWAIFDGGIRIARSQQQRAQARLARLEVAARSRDARQEVRTSWQALQRARVAFVAVEAEVTLAEEDLDLARRALDAGSGTLFEVQGARLSLAAARLARIRERTARDLAAIALLLAMGTL